jgi:hypothetical protein
MECVLAIDEAMAKLFFPQKMENRQTSEFCKELAVGVATTLLTELINPRKSTHNYINDGLLAFNNLSLAEKEASLDMRANNYPSEGNFATFTDVLCNYGRILIDSATQGAGRLDTTRILIKIMDVLSLEEGKEVGISLLKLGLSTCCQRSCRINCWPLQRRMGINQGSSSMNHCIGIARLMQRRQQTLLQ